MAMFVQPTQAANTPSIQSSATALAANPARVAWQIQNLGTNPLFVLQGTGASTTLFHFVLKGAGVQDDGSGGSYTDSASSTYTGVVTVAGTSPRYVVLERAP